MCVAHVIYSFPPRCHCLALATSRFSPQEPSREPSIMELSSSFTSASATLDSALSELVKAVVAGGGDGAPTTLPAFSAGTVSDGDKALKLSLVKLADGSFTFTPAEDAYSKTGSNTFLAVAGPAKIERQKMDWVSANIDKVWPGVLCGAGKQGARAHEVALMGVPAMLHIPDGTTKGPLTRLGVSIGGGALVAVARVQIKDGACP